MMAAPSLQEEAGSSPKYIDGITERIYVISFSHGFFLNVFFDRSAGSLSHMDFLLAAFAELDFSPERQCMALLLVARFVLLLTFHVTA